MTTIACILLFLWIKSHLLKNSSHTKNQLNGYNITGDINGRPVHTTRTYGQKSIACNAFFPYGPYVRAVLTARTYGDGPYVRVVCTGLNYISR